MCRPSFVPSKPVKLRRMTVVFLGALTLAACGSTGTGTLATGTTLADPGQVLRQWDATSTTTTTTPAPTTTVPTTTTTAPAPAPSTTSTSTSSAGLQVPSPAYSASGSPPTGATALCLDGTYSFSSSRQAACSQHGGVAAWLPASTASAPASTTTTTIACPAGAVQWTLNPPAYDAETGAYLVTLTGTVRNGTTSDIAPGPASITIGGDTVPLEVTNHVDLPPGAQSFFAATDVVAGTAVPSIGPLRATSSWVSPGVPRACPQPPEHYTLP